LLTPVLFRLFGEKPLRRLLGEEADTSEAASGPQEAY
jgi:hypothetical protein